MEFSTPREKKTLLTRYKEDVQNIREAVYKVIQTAAEYRRPHGEMKALIDLSEGFEKHGWWALDRDIEAAEEAITGKKKNP